MPSPQLFFVSGKGGTGKTTIAAALAIDAARRGKRVLVVEPGGDRRLAALFGKRLLRAEPTPLARHLHAVRVEPRELIDGYFTRVLRLPFLTRRLFASKTFNAVTAAAPGVGEFLILDKLHEWIEPGFFLRRPAYDVVIVDGPATGHALRLLRTPRQLVAMVSAGPIGSTARRLRSMLADRKRTHVILVAIPDEMAVNETVEAHAAIAHELAVDLTRPVLNRVFPRRFTRSETDLITELSRPQHNDPLLAAARLQLEARHDAERHLGRLRRAFGVLPVSVRQVCADQIGHADLESIGATVGRAMLGEQ
jgi:anion-transporting  ArsA/GET3 family ATPase